MNQLNNNNRPKMTSAGIEASYPVTVMDESGNKRETHITGERPLTIYVDKQEIVTLMTLGKYPELLVIGYLHNQGFIKQTEELKAVQVDWDIDSAVVVTKNGIGDWEEKLAKRTVTSGCGQGTVFGDLMDNLEEIQLPTPTLHQSIFTACSRTSVNTTKSTKNRVRFTAVLCAKVKILRYSSKTSDVTTPQTLLRDTCFLKALAETINYFIQQDG